MADQEYTLKDIAKIAKVSRGTIDRVIHGRGKVSKETYKKVKLILDKIDYKPNLIAQTLRKGKLFKIAVLMPDYNYDIYWKRAFQGVEKAMVNYSFIGVSLEFYLFNPFNSDSCRQECNKVLSNEFNAVLVAPYFFKESLDFFAKCEEINLPYFTFNTFLEDSKAISHIGQDLVQSGKTAASLIKKVLADDDEYLILHINEDIENARHMQEKEIGFKLFLTENNIHPSAIHVLTIDNLKQVKKVLTDKLNSNDKIRGIFVTTSKVWLAAEVLSKLAVNTVIMGYDLLDVNLKYLESGDIDFLIFQNPREQTSIGISTIIDYIVFKKKVQSNYLLPIEIVIKENMSNFLNDYSIS